MFPFGIFCSSSTHTQHQDKKGKNVFEHRICIDINMAWLSDNRFEMCLYNRPEAIDLDNDIDTKSPRSIRHVCNIQPDFSIFTLWIYSLRIRRNAQRSRHHQTDTKNTWKPRNKHVIESRATKIDCKAIRLQQSTWFFFFFHLYFFRSNGSLLFILRW